MTDKPDPTRHVCFNITTEEIPEGAHIVGVLTGVGYLRPGDGEYRVMTYVSRQMDIGDVAKIAQTMADGITAT